jgi:hypothetical protein
MSSPAPRPRQPANPRLRAQVASAGLSYTGLAAEITAAARADGRTLVVDRTRVGHWINDGQQPREPVRGYLVQVLSARTGRVLAPADLGLRPVPHSPASHSPVPGPPSAAPDPAGDPTDRRTALALLGGTALSLTAPLTDASAADAADRARAYTRHTRATDLGRDALEELDLAVHGFAAGYASRSAADLWPAVAAHRHRAHLLLHATRRTLAQARDLAHHAGMLSVVLAWLAHDLGHSRTVQAYCDDAAELGLQAGAPEVAAWAEDVRCTDHLYAELPLDALTAAIRGLALAPRGSNAAVRLAAQVARAHARLGDSHAYMHAARDAHRHRDHLPAHATGLFAVDATRILSYDATSQRWLGNYTQARDAALAAAASYAALPGPQGAPTRLAVARLDAALAHAALGDPEAAVHIAREAIGAGHPAHAALQRARQLDGQLRRLHPASGVTAAFHDELRAFG